jgi:endonuclease/exonuclease/phosphatase family metal-dependent hydrolase
MDPDHDFSPRHGRALGCWCSFGLLAANAFAAAPPATLRIATYNIENYTEENRVADGVYHADYPKPESEKTALRAVIHQLDADVLMLQEMGPPAYLAELQQDLKGEGLDYRFATEVEAVDPARHVAVLSRRPFTSVVRHTELTFKYFGVDEKMKRGLLEVRLAVGGAEWTVFAVHLKSKLTVRADDPDSELERAGEAEAVRDQILKEFPEPAAAKFIVLGDCNAGRTERPLRALMAKGKTIIAEWLPAADSRGEVWTDYWHQADTYERIDHILVSPGLRPAVMGAKICDAPETMVASDHRPVVATLKTD